MIGAGRLVPGRWSAAAYTSLMVALYVAEPAVVNLTVHDHVQLDRVTGTSAERYGNLLPPGTTPVHLAAGTYVFRTTADAQVQLDTGAAVEVTRYLCRTTRINGRIPLLPWLRRCPLPGVVARPIMCPR